MHALANCKHPRISFSKPSRHEGNNNFIGQKALHKRLPYRAKPLEESLPSLNTGKQTTLNLLKEEGKNVKSSRSISFSVTKQITQPTSEHKTRNNINSEQKNSQEYGLYKESPNRSKQLNKIEVSFEC
jgi:hypothetical protein